MLKLIILFTAGSMILNAGTLKGTVSYAGSNKTPKSLKMDSDPVCGNSHATTPLKEDFILDDNNNFKNVLVWLKALDEENLRLGYAGGSEIPVQIDQKGCVYSPHVFGVMTNQKVLIKNSDKTLHNVHSMPNENSSFNSAQPAGVADIEQSFSVAEDPFYIKCDVHPWMKAWVLVSDHPYFAVTDNNGNYEMNDIPPGTYEVIFWQEKLSNLSKKYVKVSHRKSITIGVDDVESIIEKTNLVLDYQFPKPAKKPKK